MPGEITALVHAAAAGDAAARERLMARVYQDLLRLARSHLARAQPAGDLNAPALVHEAYLRFAEHLPGDAASRRVFFQYASRAMQSVVVDQARERLAAKRGAGVAEVTLVTGMDAELPPAADDARTEQLHLALARLERVDAQLHEVVQLRCWAGLTVAEVAGLTGQAEVTVKRHYARALTILRECMG